MNEKYKNFIHQIFGFYTPDGKFLALLANGPSALASVKSRVEALALAKALGMERTRVNALACSSRLG
jgi:hypothetical protein